jgi:DNA-binding MarR family transcriptional regulator
MANATRAADRDTDELVSALLTASRTLVGVSARSLAETEDTVTPTQFRTLVVLRGHGPSRLSALAERMDVNPSTALRSVDRLIAAGLVQRRENDDDRREVVISLTDEGTGLVDRVTASRRRVIAKIVKAMPAERRRDLVEALLAFTDAAGEPPAGPDAASRLGW